MKQQFALRLGFGFGRAAENRIGAAGKTHFGGDLLLRVFHEGADVTTRRTASDRLPAARAFVQDGVATAGRINSSQLAQGNAITLGAAQEERADRLRVLPVGLV